MSNSLFLYFIQRLVFYGVNFLDTYFRGGFNFFNSLFWQIFSSLERDLAFSLNVRYFTVPFWQEYSFASYLLSIPIRAFKILTGAIILVCFSFIFWLGYLLWVIAPLYLLLKIVGI
ncbi:MAG: hypothetical protein ACP5RX_00570 [Minisyncoccia bacterium]